MTTQTLKPTLADTVLPQPTVARNLVLVLAFSAFIALMAQVSIPLPFTPVPITGQTFAVLLAAMALGPRLGVAAVLACLLEGAVGLPVFTPGGPMGLARFAGPTGGYLAGFVLAAWLAGSLAERGWTRSYALTFAGMLLSSLLIFACGTAWLGVWLGNAGKFAGLTALLNAGWFPFIPGDLVKAGLSALLLPGAWRLTGRR